MIEKNREYKNYKLISWLFSGRKKKFLKEKEKEKAAHGWKVKIQENKEGGLRHSIGGED